MSEALVPVLSAGEARTLTDEVKRDAQALWSKLVRLYDGGAHLALGYASWHAYCEAEFGFGRSHSYRLLDAGRVVEAIPQLGNEAQARELVPLLDDEAELVEVWRELRDEYGEAVTATRIRRLVAGRIARVERERELEARRHRELAEAERAIARNGGAWQLLPPTPVAELELEHEVDAIVTDPPYLGDCLPLYGDLARFAERSLRAGGVLAVMTWQGILDGVLDELRVGELRYRWTMSWDYDEPEGTARQRVWQQRFFAYWKPVLVLSRGELDVGWGADRVRGSRDKRLHPWGQGADGFRQIVKRLTRPGELVCDPFCGAGTTGIACLASSRRFVGSDVDEAALELARGRLAA